MSLVSLVEARSKSDFKGAIERSLDLIHYKFTREVKNIIIKPNMCYYWDYSTGETTDPDFVAALIDVLRNKVSNDVRISIVESDASAMRCKYAFKFLGYEKLAKRREVDLLNLSKEESERVEVSVEDHTFHFMVPLAIRNADLRVNVAKIKYHPLTKISCALKNIYGCNPYQKKYKYHQQINEVIVALNKVMNFDLCVIDGITVVGSQPRKLGLVMASRDPVALDASVARLARVNPRAIRHLVMASKEGVGSLSSETVGASLRQFERRFPKKEAMSEIMEFGYKLVTILGLSNRLGLTS